MPNVELFKWAQAMRLRAAAFPGIVHTIEAIALREGKTERSIRMTLSLAFLAPDIVKAAIDGRLPRGFSLKRLIDLPIVWPDQWRALGLDF